jgi:hypothetical protein
MSGISSEPNVDVNQMPRSVQKRAYARILSQKQRSALCFCDRILVQALNPESRHFLVISVEISRNTGGKVPYDLKQDISCSKCFALFHFP